MAPDYSSLAHELRETLGKMELALSVIDEGIVWTDAHGRVQWCNKRFDALVMRPHITILGRPLHEIMPLAQNRTPLPADAHPAVIAMEQETDILDIYEFSRDNDNLTLEIHAVHLPIRENDSSIVLMIRDISGEEEADLVRLQGATLAAAANAIAITNADGHIMWVNPAFTTLTGYALDEVYGKSMNILKSGDQDDTFYQDLWQTILNGRVWKGRLLNRRKDGELYFEEQTVTPVVGDDGDVSHFIAIKSDVTRQRHAEHALRASEAKKNAILTTAADAIVTINTQGVITDVNPACEIMFDYTSGQLVGKNVNILMPQPIRDEHDGYIKRYLETQIPHIIGARRELTGVRRSGETFPIELSVSEVKVEEEHLFTAIVRDVTARKRAEEQLSRANEELEQKQRRLSEDLKAAAGIQLALLPGKDLAIPNLDIAWKYTPSEYVSGDLFNVFMVDDEHLAIYMLDVSGHGAPASLVAVSVSQLLQPRSNFVHNLKNGRIREPIEVLELMDKEFPIERFDKYFTMLYIILNIHTGALRYSNAGHPPPIILRPGRQPRTLDKGGTFIGLGGVLPFEQGAYKLAHEEKLLLITDGIYEFESSGGEIFGLPRLYEHLSTLSTSPPRALLESLLAELATFGDAAAPQDDISVLCLETSFSE